MGLLLFSPIPNRIEIQRTPLVQLERKSRWRILTKDLRCWGSQFWNWTELRIDIEENSWGPLCFSISRVMPFGLPSDFKVGFSDVLSIPKESMWMSSNQLQGEHRDFLSTPKGTSRLISKGSSLKQFQRGDPLGFLPDSRRGFFGLFVVLTIFWNVKETLGEPPLWNGMEI